MTSATPSPVPAPPPAPISTLIVALLDRSGSMQGSEGDVQGGFNAFMADQRAVPGECLVSLYQFDTEFERVYNAVPVADVPDLLLHPRGGTALLDSLGHVIEDVDMVFKDTSTPPDQVIIIVMTDGEENQSKTFKLDQVKEMVEDRQMRGWVFVFIGAGIDAFQEARTMAVAATSTIASGRSSAAYGATFSTLSSATTRARTSGTAGVSTGKADFYLPEEREKVAETLKEETKKKSTSEGLWKKKK